MSGGRLWGFLFFLFMSFAAVTTIIAVFENIVAFAMDSGWSRKKAVRVNFILILLLSLPCAFGFNLLSFIEPLGDGSTIQDLEDFIVSNNMLPLGSLMYLLFCTFRYGWGWKNFTDEANSGVGFQFPMWARFYVSYILPVEMCIRDSSPVSAGEFLWYVPPLLSLFSQIPVPDHRFLLSKP